MKVISINSAVLGGQGHVGSVPAVPNPAPPQGPAAGDSSLSTAITVGNAPTNGGGIAPKSGDPKLGSEA